MTKRHFMAIAKIVDNAKVTACSADTAQRKADYERGAEGTRKHIATALADMFAGENPRFDRERFLAACGVAS